MLVNIIRGCEPSFCNLTLDADGNNLAARVRELAGVIGQEFSEIKSEFCELGSVEIRAARLNDDVARRKLRGQQRFRIERQRQTSAGKTSGKPELTGRGGV